MIFKITMMVIKCDTQWRVIALSHSSLWMETKFEKPKDPKIHPKEKTLRKEKRKRKGGHTKFICEVFQISDGIAR